MMVIVMVVGMVRMVVGMMNVHDELMMMMMAMFSYSRLLE